MLPKKLFLLFSIEKVTIIKKGKQIPIKEYNINITYDEFVKNKKELLNLVTMEEYESHQSTHLL